MVLVSDYVNASDCLAGTAIETPMNVTVRLTVLKDKPYVKTPHFTTRSPHAHDEEFYCTTGVDSGTSEPLLVPLASHQWLTHPSL